MDANRRSSQVVAIVFVSVLCLAALPTFGQQSQTSKAAETATLALLETQQTYQQSSATQKQQSSSF